jgi:predicted RNase H-like HicB family nuclease
MVLTDGRRRLKPTLQAEARATTRGRMMVMTGKVSVVIEQDEDGCYAWCPELKGCQSQGRTIEETLLNIREAIELFLETLTVWGRRIGVG